MHYALIQNKQKTKTINYDIYYFRAYVYISKTHQNNQLWYLLFYTYVRANILNYMCILTEVGECRIHSVYEDTNFNL